DLALADYNQAVALSPDDPNAYFSRGNGHMAKGNLELARSDFEQAIRLYPSTSPWYARALEKKAELDTKIVAAKPAPAAPVAI
ncbi:tetratricopeptide repeat protein, partial [Acinetobacter baumannii]